MFSVSLYTYAALRCLISLVVTKLDEYIHSNDNLEGIGCP